MRYAKLYNFTQSKKSGGNGYPKMPATKHFPFQRLDTGKGSGRGLVSLSSKVIRIEATQGSKDFLHGIVGPAGLHYGTLDTNIYTGFKNYLIKE